MVFVTGLPADESAMASAASARCSGPTMSARLICRTSSVVYPYSRRQLGFASSTRPSMSAITTESDECSNSSRYRSSAVRTACSALQNGVTSRATNTTPTAAPDWSRPAVAYMYSATSLPDLSKHRMPPAKSPPESIAGRSTPEPPGAAVQMISNGLPRTSSAQ